MFSLFEKILEKLEQIRGETKIYMFEFKGDNPLFVTVKDSPLILSTSSFP